MIQTKALMKRNCSEPVASSDAPTTPKRRTWIWLLIAPFAALGGLLLNCVLLVVGLGLLFHFAWDAPKSLNTGARYDPAAGVWTEMSTENAPSGRYNPYVFWTGEEMLVWGGFVERADFPVNDTVAIGGGGLYNPVTNSWRKMASDGDPGGRRDAVVVWTGSELFVWGGIGGGGRSSKSTNDGAIYNLATNSWRQMSNDGGPSPRFNSVGVWTGTELIVWGGNTAPPSDTGCGNYAGDGARYDPATDSWTPLPAVGAPNGRRDAVAVWTGREALFVGGDTGAHGCPTLATAGRFSPSANGWFEMSPTRPAFDSLDGAEWTGSELVVWGTSLPPFGIIQKRLSNFGATTVMSGHSRRIRSGSQALRNSTHVSMGIGSFSMAPPEPVLS